MATVLPHFSIYINYKTVKQLTKWKRDEVVAHFHVKESFVPSQKRTKKRDVLQTKSYFLQIPTNIAILSKVLSFITQKVLAYPVQNVEVDSRECDYKLK